MSAADGGGAGGDPNADYTDANNNISFRVGESAIVLDHSNRGLMTVEGRFKYPRAVKLSDGWEARSVGDEAPEILMLGPGDGNNYGSPLLVRFWPKDISTVPPNVSVSVDVPDVTDLTGNTMVRLERRVRVTQGPPPPAARPQTPLRTAARSRSRTCRTTRTARSTSSTSIIRAAAQPSSFHPGAPTRERTGGTVVAESHQVSEAKSASFAKIVDEKSIERHSTSESSENELSECYPIRSPTSSDSEDGECGVAKREDPECTYTYQQQDHDVKREEVNSEARQMIGSGGTEEVDVTKKVANTGSKIFRNKRKKVVQDAPVRDEPGRLDTERVGGLDTERDSGVGGESEVDGAKSREGVKETTVLGPRTAPLTVPLGLAPFDVKETSRDHNSIQFDIVNKDGKIYAFKAMISCKYFKCPRPYFLNGAYETHKLTLNYTKFKTASLLLRYGEALTNIIDPERYFVADQRLVRSSTAAEVTYVIQ